MKVARIFKETGKLLNDTTAEGIERFRQESLQDDEVIVIFDIDTGKIDLIEPEREF